MHLILDAIVSTGLALGAAAGLVLLLGLLVVPLLDGDPGRRQRSRSV